MTLHDQILLMAAVLGLYLYDAMLLLYHNEIVFESRRRGYHVSAGAPVQVGGRHLYLPNPCLPHRMLIRLHWPDADVQASGKPGRQGVRTRLALQVIAPWTWLLLVLMIVGLPSAMWAGTSNVLLVWLMCTYSAIVMMLIQVFRYRDALGLSRRAATALAFDALLCAPFAINMVRKISLRQTPPHSLRSMAACMLSATEQARLKQLLQERIHLSLDFIEPGSAAGNELIAYLKHFEEARP